MIILTDTQTALPTVSSLVARGDPRPVSQRVLCLIRLPMVVDMSVPCVMRLSTATCDREALALQPL